MSGTALDGWVQVKRAAAAEQTASAHRGRRDKGILAEDFALKE
jgi:hypothetical protein